MQKILLLEDNQSDANLVGAEIKNRWPKVKLITVSRLAEARKLMQDAESFDVALFDLKLPDGNGMDLLSELREQNCETPIIIFTSEGSEEIATTALKTGANDYIPKKTGFQKKIPNLIEYTLNQALSNKQHLSVLYIEHHKSDIDLTLHHFKKYAPYIHLTIVSTGEEALNLLPDKGDTLSNFDVLLVDYNLPKYNALEISKIIRQERKLSIAMVIVTGQGDENIAVEALKLGVDDYVVKHENYLLRLPSVITGAFRRKELERQKQALTISETKYRLLADYASDCEYWINPKGEYIYISPACEKTTGYPQEAFIKNKNLLIEISLPEYREILTEHFTQKVKVLHEPIEFQILTADGKQSWISQFCQPVYDENNKYAGRRGVNRDITEHKLAEIELRQSEDRFKRLFEELGDAVFVTGIGAENMGKILEANSSAERQTGYSKSELLQMNIANDLFIEGSGDMNLDVWDKKLRNGESVLTTEKKRKKDGTEYWTEVIVTQIEFRGELAGLSINRDITERKQTEEELKAREKRANNQRIAIAKIAIDKTLTDINLYEGFRNITEVVSTAIIVERISIWILSEDGLTLNCMSLYETGKKKHSSGTSLLAENFPCYFDAIKKESRIYAYDAQADPRTAELKDEYLVPLGITSMLDAGINIDGKLSGVICMEHIGEKRKWEVDEEAFVSTVASIIAQAIINSKRLRAEEILLKMNKAINNSGEVILMTDKEGIITFVNPEFTKMYGYTAEEVIGKVTPRILKSGIHEPEVYENFWHTLLNKQSFKGFHYINKCKNGRIIDAEASADPILDDNGEITGFLAIQRDISERIRSEKIQNVLLNISNATQEANDLAEILKIIQKELGRLMDAENFFVALYDEETDRIHLPYYQDEKDEIKDFPAGKTLTGLVIKQGESLLIDSAEAKKLEAENKIEKVGLDSEIWLGVPLKIKGKVTGAFVVQSYTNPNAYTEKDKEVLEIISHQISISIERKREEAKLLAALEAVKESDRIKTAFLANMSHELRTPLNAVIGFSELIDANTEAADSFEYAQLINKSGKNLLGIVDEIFEMTLIERGQLDLKRSKMSISFFLNDIYQTILHRQINQGDTTIKIEQKIKGIDSQTEGFTDFNKLKQICLSVLGNALKFTEEGFIRFGVFPSEDEKDFVFFVKDTGIGIPKEMHKSIFERFKIADESLTRKYAGIGAGLFISRKLIALLGGEIWLESEEGKGSTFYFKIPR